MSDERSEPLQVEMLAASLRADTTDLKAFLEALAKKLAALEKDLKSRLDINEAAIVEVLQRVMAILDPPPLPPEPPRREMGFHAPAADAPKTKARAVK